MILNIGLASEAYGAIPAWQALQTLKLLGITHGEPAAIRRSSTEPTLAVEVPDTVQQGTLWKLSLLLGQDCVATWDGKAGALIGPNALAWGEFNPEFFLMLDGQALGVPA